MCHVEHSTWHFLFLEMTFAKSYLEKYTNDYSVLAPSNINFGLGILIPCYNEPDLLKTLNSIANCRPIASIVAIVVVINSKENSPQEVFLQNQKTLTEVSSFEPSKWLQLYIIEANRLPKKHAGVGWARKIGMDWLVSAYNHMQNPEGIIVSLDADSEVDPNYLIEIEKGFRKNQKKCAATFGFEHNLEGSEFPEKVYHSIILYELYLRYYYHAVRLTGFPNSIYTIGSCMAVRAKDYIAVGGMNRKQAGEDFYFLQKLVNHRGVVHLPEVKVFPSSRVSDRVPFGTGAQITKLVNTASTEFYVYSLEAFSPLAELFQYVNKLYEPSNFSFKSSFHEFHDFLTQINFELNIDRILKNSASPKTFAKNFYSFFNGFQIIKWLNFSAERNFKKKNTITEAIKLLEEIYPDKHFSTLSPKNVLNIYRKLDI